MPLPYATQLVRHLKWTTCKNWRPKTENMAEQLRPVCEALRVAHAALNDRNNLLAPGASDAELDALDEQVVKWTSELDYLEETIEVLLRGCPIELHSSTRKRGFAFSADGASSQEDLRAAKRVFDHCRLATPRILDQPFALLEQTARTLCACSDTSRDYLRDQFGSELSESFYRADDDLEFGSTCHVQTDASVSWGIEDDSVRREEDELDLVEMDQDRFEPDAAPVAPNVDALEEASFDRSDSQRGFLKTLSAAAERSVCMIDFHASSVMQRGSCILSANHQEDARSWAGYRSSCRKTVQHAFEALLRGWRFTTSDQLVLRQLKSGVPSDRVSQDACEQYALSVGRAEKILQRAVDTFNAIVDRSILRGAEEQSRAIDVERLVDALTEECPSPIDGSPTTMLACLKNVKILEAISMRASQSTRLDPIRASDVGLATKVVRATR